MTLLRMVKWRDLGKKRNKTNFDALSRNQGFPIDLVIHGGRIIVKNHTMSVVGALSSGVERTKSVGVQMNMVLGELQKAASEAYFSRVEWWGGGNYILFVTN